MLVLSNEDIARLRGGAALAARRQYRAEPAFVVRKARETGVGTELPDDWFSEDVHP